MLPKPVEPSEELPKTRAEFEQWAHENLGLSPELEAALDAQGELRQDIALPQEVKGNTPVKAIVSGSLFETGGRSVNRSVERVLWPADALVGVRPLFDDKDGADSNANARFELMRYGSDGQPRPAKGLKLSLVREYRDYHWTHDEDSGWDYDFTRRFETVETRTVDAGATALRFDFPVEWGDYRIEVFDPATKLTMRYPFRAGWGWDDENRGLDARPDKVKLALDKTAYRTGDTLKATLTPPHAGKGLVMVESDRMLFVQAVDVKPGTVVEIPVTRDWERHDVYVTALVFRGGSATSKITPARAVGVAWVPMDPVEPSSTRSRIPPILADGSQDWTCARTNALTSATRSGVRPRVGTA